MAFRERPARFQAGAIEECPGCHTRVMVSRDLSCPSCQCDMPSTKDDGMRRLRVFDHQALPPWCAGCGETTERYESLSAGNHGTNPIVRLLMGLASPVLALLMPGAGTTVDVSIPRCRACAEAGPLRLEHVNLSHGCVTVLVHHRLHEAVRASKQGG